MKLKSLITFLLAAAAVVSCKSELPEFVPQTPDPKPEADSTIAGRLSTGKPFEIAMKRLGSIKSVGKFNVTQGMTSDGTYVYFALLNNESGKSMILKYSLDPYTFVAQGEEFDGGHCNDIAYNSVDKQLVVVHSSPEGTVYSIVDPETLNLVKDVNALACSAIVYNAKRDCFALSGGKVIKIADRSFNLLRQTDRVDDSGFVFQGMGADDSYIYFPMSKKDSNCIMEVYDWDGTYITRLTIPSKKEVESMTYAAGKYYASFYYSSTGSCGDFCEIYPK